MFFMRLKLPRLKERKLQFLSANLSRGLITIVMSARNIRVRVDDPSKTDASVHFNHQMSRSCRATG